jgi:hypothetical protein
MFMMNPMVEVQDNGTKKVYICKDFDTNTLIGDRPVCIVDSLDCESESPSLKRELENELRQMEQQTNFSLRTNSLY